MEAMDSLLSRPKTPEITGPWQVVTTSSTTGSALPLTSISSRLTSASRKAPACSYHEGRAGSNRSTNRSSQSPYDRVIPHAIRAS